MFVCLKNIQQHDDEQQPNQVTFKKRKKIVVRDFEHFRVLNGCFSLHFNTDVCGFLCAFLRAVMILLFDQCKYLNRNDGHLNGK